MNTRRTLRLTAATLLLPLALVACDDDNNPTGPASSQGTVTAEIHDGASGGGGGAQGATAAGSFTGTATGNAQVSIYAEGRGWVALGSPARTTVTMQSNTRTVVHGTAAVPADTYTRVRLVMDGFDASLQAGGIISGVTLTGNVTIRVGGSDGRVEVEKTVSPFTVRAGATTTVGFDLNSQFWIDQTTTQTRVANDAEVQSAVAAYVNAS